MDAKSNPWWRRIWLWLQALEDADDHAGMEIFLRRLTRIEERVAQIEDRRQGDHGGGQ